MTIYPYLKAHAIALTLSLMTACAIDDGRGWGELELEIMGALDVAQGRYDATAKAYNSADDYHVQIDRFHYRFSTLSLLAKAGGTFSFDPSNPPAPYTNCHAGHCHRTDSEITETYEEIEAKLSGNAAAGASQLFEQSLDFSSAFTEEPTRGPTLVGSLDRGQSENLSITLDNIEIEGKFKKKTETNWQNFAYQLAPDQNIQISTDIDLNVDRGQDYHVEYLVKLQMALNFIDFRNWDDLSNDPKLPAALKASLKLSAEKQ